MCGPDQEKLPDCGGGARLYRRKCAALYCVCHLGRETPLSTILNYYNPKFGAEDFLRIVAWMPYIVELEFENQEYLSMRELAYVQKPYLKN